MQTTLEPLTGCESGSQMVSGSGDLANLDVLRAVAVLVVLFGHLAGTMKVRLLGDLGHFGVLLFFVHTALVLMMSMERLKLTGFSLFASFMTRRIFRIYPLNTVAILIVLAARIPATSWGAGFYQWPGLKSLVSNLLLAQNLTGSPSLICVLWSLPFEIQMYAVLPFMFLWLTAVMGTRRVWLLMGGAVALAGLEYAVRMGPAPNLDSLVFRYFPCFISGLITWRLIRTKSPRVPGFVWIFVLAFLVAGYRMVDVVRVYGLEFPSALRGGYRSDHGIWWPHYCDLVRDWVFCLAVGLGVPLFTEIRFSPLKVAGKLIAKYSYGIYLSHVPIFWFVFVHLGLTSRLLGACFSLILVATVSVLAYHLLEDPAIQIGKRLASKLVRAS